jgi:CRP-like cAMP-binding protein
MSFYWANSPLSIAAAQERAERDATLAAANRRERSEELTRFERFGMSAAEAHNPGGFSDVRSACRRWLAARGMLQIRVITPANVNPDSLTQRVRDLLAASTEPVTTRQVADALDMTVENASKRLGHLAARGEVRIVRRVTPPAGDSRSNANRSD